MKILVVGGTGMIGSEALSHCLSHPRITRVVAFVRRRQRAQQQPQRGQGEGKSSTNSSNGVTNQNHHKLETVQVDDFATIWSNDEVMRKHVEDAEAMIWAMGSYQGCHDADLEYPTAFLEGMGRLLNGVCGDDDDDNDNDGASRGQKQNTGRKFRFVHLSGKFVRQDQETRLCFLEVPRKMKGLMETRALEFEEKHAEAWETLIVKPGGVAPKRLTGGGVLGMVTGLGSVLGDGWSVKVDELGAFMAFLAVEGGGGYREHGMVIENDIIAKKGREILSNGS